MGVNKKKILKLPVMPRKKVPEYAKLLRPVRLPPIMLESEAVNLVQGALKKHNVSELDDLSIKFKVLSETLAISKVPFKYYIE